MPDVTIKLRGQDFTFSPLTFKQLRTLTKLQSAKPEDFMANLDHMAEFVADALRVNHPDITIDQVNDALDLTNVHEALAACVKACGLTVTGAAAGAAAGEAQAGQ